jgi:hypothetical protein
MWYVVRTGAVLNVFVLWLFDLSRATHLVLGGVLMIFIGLVVYLVAVLDHAALPGSLRHPLKRT